MTTNDSLQRYIDAGVAFTNMTRKKAEELVNELVQNGDLQRGEARARVDDLLERSRQGTEVFVTAVRGEVTRQLEAVGITNLEELAKQVAALLGRGAETAKRATPRKAAPKKAPAKKAAAKKAPAKKAAPKKKAAAKKAAPKKRAAAEQAPAEKAVATEAVPVQPTAPQAPTGTAD